MNPKRIMCALVALASSGIVWAKSVVTDLPLLKLCDGVAEVRVTGTAAWCAAEEGRYYALGSSFRVREGGKLVLAFGPECTATIAGDAGFTTRIQPLGSKVRVIELGAGTLDLDLARNLPAGVFRVVTPGFCVSNLVGQSRFTYTDCGDGDDVDVRCVTGSLSIEGRHYAIARMSAADEVRIRTTHDCLETFLRGISGDYIARIDRGLGFKQTVNDDGSVTESTERSCLDWHLSPQTKVRISRCMPALGKRMSVAVMTFDTTGELKNNFAFSEDRAEVNTGELVAATVEQNAEETKRAAKAAEENQPLGEKNAEAKSDGDDESAQDNEKDKDKEEKVEKKSEEEEEK